MFYKKIFLFFTLILLTQKSFANNENASYKSVLFLDYSPSIISSSNDILKLSASQTNNITFGTGIFTKVLNKDVLLYSKAGIGTGQGSNQKDDLLRPYVLIGFDYYDNILTKAVYKHNLLSRKHKFLVGMALGYSGIYNKYSNTNPENITTSGLYYNQVRINGGGLIVELNLGYEYAFFRNHNIGIKLSTQASLFNTFDINTITSEDGTLYQRYYNNVDSYITSTSVVLTYKYFIETKI